MRLDCKTVKTVSKSVKKSVKRGVRVLHAQSAQALHARRACEAREKSLSPVSLSVFRLVPDLLFDCSRLLEYAKIRTVLQSNLRSLFSLFGLAIDSGIVYNTKHENQTNRRKQKEQLNITYYERRKILRGALNTRPSILASSRDSKVRELSESSVTSIFLV